MEPGGPPHGGLGGEPGRSGGRGDTYRALVPPDLAQQTAPDSQRLHDALAWLRSAALTSGRLPEAQGGVLGGSRDAAASQLLLAARRALSLARPTPAASGEPQAGARAPRRVGRAATTSGDEALLNEDATVTRSGLPLHSYERCVYSPPHTRPSAPAVATFLATETHLSHHPGMTRASGARTRPAFRTCWQGRRRPGVAHPAGTRTQQRLALATPSSRPAWQS